MDRAAEELMKSAGSPSAFLRVHAPQPAQGPAPIAASVSDHFWSVFGQTTGWAPALQSLNTRGGDSMELRWIAPDGMLDAELVDSSSSLTRNTATQLASAAQKILDRLHQAETRLRQQELELASRALPRLPRRTSRKLDKTIAELLRHGVTAARCAAAAFYTLDEETTHLKLRARYGIPLARLQDPPRPLRGAMADLEAMVSRVAVMERLTGEPSWNSPEPWEAGMCAAVMLDDLPIGTLWMWRARTGKFSKAAQSAIRVTADRLASELQNALSGRTKRRASTHRKILREGRQWQQHALPAPTPLAPEWLAAGWQDTRDPLTSAWHTWDVLPDGTIALALCQGIGGSCLANAFTATTIRSAWQAHAGYRSAPQQVISRVSDTLWQTSEEPSQASLFYAKLNPDSGEADVAWAGDLPMLIASTFGYRPVGESSPPLGSQPDLQPHSTHIRLEPGECLVIATPGLIQQQGLSIPGRLTQLELAGLVREHLREKPAAIVTAIHRHVAVPKRKIPAPRGLVLLQHAVKARSPITPPQARPRTRSQSKSRSSRKV